MNHQLEGGRSAGAVVVHDHGESVALFGEFAFHLHVKSDFS
jgi:hypothetical protein